jgi:hypothetical protein
MVALSNGGSVEIIYQSRPTLLKSKSSSLASIWAPNARHLFYKARILTVADRLSLSSHPLDAAECSRQMHSGMNERRCQRIASL